MDYLKQQAADARKMALSSINGIARDNWIEIAKRWERLADDAARNSGVIPNNSNTTVDRATPIAEPE